MRQINAERAEERARFLAPFVTQEQVAAGAGAVQTAFRVPSLSDPQANPYVVRTWGWGPEAWTRWGCNCERGRRGGQGDNACVHIRAARIHAGVEDPTPPPQQPAPPAKKPRTPWVEEIDTIAYRR